MACLVAESERLIQTSLSHNSKQVYKTALKNSIAFWNCTISQKFGPYLSIQSFILSLTCQYKNFPHLYVRTLSFYHKLKGLQDTTKSFLICKALEGFKRTIGRAVDTGCPIIRPLLRELILSLPSVCSSTYEATLFTLITIHYHKQLQWLTLHSISNVNVHAQQSDFKVFFSYSKTDQKAHKTTLIISKELETVLCPLRAISSYLSIRPSTSPAAPFFIQVNLKPLRRYHFNAVLQKALISLVEQGHFCTHSFRIGRATDMALHGVSDKVIKVAGRWNSRVYSSYDRM